MTLKACTQWVPMQLSMAPVREQNRKHMWSCNGLQMRLRVLL